MKGIGKLASALLALLTCGSLQPLAAVESEYALAEFESGLDGWLSDNTGEFGLEGGAARLVADGTGAAWLYRSSFMSAFDAYLDDYNTVQLRIRYEGARAEVPVVLGYGTDLSNGVVSRSGFTLVADGQYHEYDVQMDFDDEWAGELDDLWIQFAGAEAGDIIHVDFIRLGRTDHYTSLGEFRRSREGWAKRSVGNFSLADGSLHAVGNGADAAIEYIGLDAEFGLRCEAWNIIELRMRTDPAAPPGEGALYFGTADEPGFDPARSLAFPLVHDGNFHTYYIYMGDHLSWTGVLRDLRLHPFEDGQGRYFDVDSIRLRKSFEVSQAEFASGLEGWTLSGMASGGVGSGILSATMTAADPHLYGPDVSADQLDLFFYNTVEIRMKLESGASGAGELFFATDSSGNFSADKSVSFPIKADGNFHTYRVNIGHHPASTGILKQLRLDPAGGETEGMTVEIDHIRLQHAPVTYATQQMLEAVDPLGGPRQHAAWEKVNAIAQASVNDSASPYNGTDGATWWLSTHDDMEKASSLGLVWHVEDLVGGGTAHAGYAAKAREIFLDWALMTPGSGMDLDHMIAYGGRTINAFALVYSLIHTELTPLERVRTEDWLRTLAYERMMPLSFDINGSGVYSAPNGHIDYVFAGIAAAAVSGDDDLLTVCTDSPALSMDLMGCMSGAIIMASEEGGTRWSFHGADPLRVAFDGEMTDRSRIKNDIGEGNYTNAGIAYAFLQMKFLLFSMEICRNNGLDLFHEVGPNGENPERPLEFYAKYIATRDANFSGHPLPEGRDMYGPNGFIGYADGVSHLYYYGANTGTECGIYDIGNRNYPGNPAIIDGLNSNDNLYDTVLKYTGALLYGPEPQTVLPVAASESSFFASSTTAARTILPFGYAANQNFRGVDSMAFASANAWLGAAGDVDGAWVAFDLGGLYDLSALKVYNNAHAANYDRGVREFDLQVSGDTINWTTIATGLTLDATTGAGAEWQHIPFVATDCRYVRFFISSNHGDPDFVGLGQVRFEGTAAAGQLYVDPGSISVNTGALGEFGPDWPASKMIDGSGLQGTHDRTNVTANYGSTNNWFSTSGQTTGDIIWTFDSNLDLQSMLVWNANDGVNAWRGVREYRLYASAEAEGDNWTTLVDQGELAYTSNSNIWLGPEIVPIDAGNVRRIRMEVLSNHGASLTGLQEVAFVSAFNGRGSAGDALNHSAANFVISTDSGTGEILLDLFAIRGFSYQLQRCPDLRSGVWLNVGTPITGDMEMKRLRTSMSGDTVFFRWVAFE